MELLTRYQWDTNKSLLTFCRLALYPSPPGSPIHYWPYLVSDYMSEGGRIGGQMEGRRADPSSQSLLSWRRSFHRVWSWLPVSVLSCLRPSPYYASCTSVRPLQWTLSCQLKCFFHSCFPHWYAPSFWNTIWKYFFILWKVHMFLQHLLLNFLGLLAWLAYWLFLH